MMTPNEQYYQAFMNNDRRFDGRVYVGVKSTGIYCRPICTAKAPLLKNCSFYTSAAQAEQAGFRPCLKCRPELAPGSKGIPAENSQLLAVRAAEAINSEYLQNSSLSQLASDLGATDRHLRRVFQEYWHVTPVAYAQTHRLLFAKQLLTETQLPITHIAYAAGFDSISRFNSLFKQQYQLAPRNFRARKPLADTKTIQLTVSYRPPFDWQALIAFLQGRQITTIESISEHSYRRSAAIVRGDQQYAGWLEVRNDAPHNRLVITLSSSLIPVSAHILSRLRALFDTNCQPALIAQALNNLPQYQPGLRVPGAFDGFEMAVRAIVGQQISVAAAAKIAGRIAEKFGTAVSTPYAEVSQLFPSAQVIARAPLEEIITCGLYSKRAQAIKALAQACVDGLQLTPTSNVAVTIENLQKLPGIGAWTAGYIAMRALSWPDAFLDTDHAIKKVLAKQGNILQYAEAWHPWRAYATMAIWQSLAKQETI